MTKDSNLPDGATGYGFSRSRLRQKGAMLLEKAARNFEHWLLTDAKDFIKLPKDYIGQNPFLGTWRKSFYVLREGFIDAWFGSCDNAAGMAVDLWGETLDLKIREKRLGEWPLSYFDKFNPDFA